MKNILIGTAALAALLGSAACVPTSSEEASAPEPVQTSPEQTEPAPEQTEHVEVNPSDGLFSYELSGGRVQDSFSDVFGDVYHPDEDHFYVVEVTATNESSSPASAPDPWMMEHVYAIDTEGRTHMVDDEPWTGDFNVNPGASVTYDAAWDLPEGVEVEYVELSAYDAPGVATLEAP